MTTISRPNLSPAALAVTAVTLATPTTALAESPHAVSLATLAPSLPPTWQIAIGGTLYLNPVLRILSRTGRRIAAWFSRKPIMEAASVTGPMSRLVNHVNQSTGAVEQVVGSIRDSLPVSIGCGLLAGAQIILGGDSVTSHAALLTATGLSFLSRHDRWHHVEKEIIYHQLDSGERLTPEGWKRQEAAALGIFAPPVPLYFPEKDQRGSKSPEYAKNAKPGFSLARAFRNIGTMINLISFAARAYADEEGPWKTLKSRLATLALNRPAAISPEHLKVVDLLMSHWGWSLCESYGITLLPFKDIEKLEALKDQKVVLSGWLHDAIYPNFLLWIDRPRARFVADKKNFHDSKIMRVIGLAWFLDVMGLPFVERYSNGKNGNGDLYQNMIALMQKHGILPLVFGQAGRSEPAYHEDGSLDEPGIYSNVVKSDKPERYYNLNGTIRAALEAAKQSGQPAYIPILYMTGGGRVMPKVASKPPFIQRVQPGEIGVSIPDVICVNSPAPDEGITQEMIDFYVPHILEAVKRAGGDNERLKDRVAAWAGSDEMGEAFAKLADKNEIYYVVADRIRSVHPKLQERNLFKKRLLELIVLAQKGRFSPEGLNRLLHDVSAFIKKPKKYKPW